MRNLTVTERINVPADRAWEILSRGAGESVGREVRKWVEGEGVRLGSAERALPLRSARVGVSVRHAAPAAAEVTFQVDYRVGWGPLGWLVNAALLRPAMRRWFIQAIERLERRAAAPGPTPNKRREGKLVEARMVLAA